ncbi:MAG: iron-sulfur cluster carrier protein ApbC [Proteobacteria bacterium]|nr:iron-sulfur cluster carrier protein ApbC [Pseudomonadota bacterium]NOG59834.1 iron-sulfur cluster carrier protein ApbC [Pseudomonadota bacterium]
MSAVSREQVEKVLFSIEDPNIKQDLISAKVVKDISIDGDSVAISLQFAYPLESSKQELSELVKTAISELGISNCTVDISSKIISHSVQKGVPLLSNVKNTIAVASGKGGVGKSTTSINLALALQAEGATVGILDADIYGPSQPRMLGLQGKPDSEDGKSVEPKVSYGVQSMSIGYLIEEDTPMIWRGPMVTGALEQLLNDTNWKDLDYLIIDLPPGTGDIQLTLCQKIPVSGAVIVTTPQDIALLDAKKALKMFEKVSVPVLGIIENMSTHICSECGHEEHIFGSGGGEQMAKQYGVDLLGSLPLDISIREGVDNGKPTVAMEPESAIAVNYRNIARRTAAKLAQQSKDYSNKFPKIVIENN